MSPGFRLDSPEGLYFYVTSFRTSKLFRTSGFLVILVRGHVQLFHFHNCKRHLKKRTIALDPLPPSPQRTLCTLVKMMKIMDDPLTLIVNQSLGSGIFPNKLKIAKVIPIFKKDDAHLLNNYRPISLLPTISKVLKKLFRNI